MKAINSVCLTRMVMAEIVVGKIINRFRIHLLEKIKSCFGNAHRFILALTGHNQEAAGSSVGVVGNAVLL